MSIGLEPGGEADRRPSTTRMRCRAAAVPLWILLLETRSVRQLAGVYRRQAVDCSKPRALRISERCLSFGRLGLFARAAVEICQTVFGVCLADCVHCERVEVQQGVGLWPTAAVRLYLALEPIDDATLRWRGSGHSLCCRHALTPLIEP